MSQRKSVNKFTYFFIALILVVLLTVFGATGYLGPVQNLLINTLSPIAHGFSKAGDSITGSFSFIANIRRLREDSLSYKKRIEELSVEVARLKEYEKENAILREQLGFKAKTDYNLIPTFVVGYDPSNFSQFIIIDVGEKNGIKNGMSVVISKGILIGRVTEVNQNTSKVLLLIDSRSLVPAMIQNSRATGIVRGEHGLGLIMDTIPQDEEIKVGDKVITSGLDGESPKGLLIGEIDLVEKSSNELFQKAKLKTLNNYQGIEMAFVIEK